MKKLLAALLCITIVLMFAGCSALKIDFGGGKTKDNDDQNGVLTNENTHQDNGEATYQDGEEDTLQNGENDEDSEFAYNNEYISDHLGSDYSVTYNFTYYENNEETGTAVVSIKKNETGYYYELNDGGEFMYLKEGDGYVLCTKDEETGKFSKLEGITLTEDEVKNSAEAVFSFMSYYQDYEDDLSSKGTDTVCGRTCDKYVLNAADWGVSSTIEFYIDKDTGVCLKYSVEASANGERGGFDYVCTEFSLANVVLPQCDD
ncbi:MAG: hypothetical protein VB118_09905 [Oscillospiraceae bacterium]|nr:hypothetical protein [Oscillospiraceae bacterium]